MKRLALLPALALVATLSVAATPALATWPGGRGAIAFHAYVQPGHDIFAMNPDGTFGTNLTGTKTAWEFNPSYSPDGTKIAYERGTGEQADIWVMNADGSGQSAIVTANGDDRSPTWSPDGTKIAFTRTNLNTGATNLFIADAAGGGVEQLTTTGEVTYGRVAWDPDGSSIVVSVMTDETYGYGAQLVRIDVATKVVSFLTTLSGVDHYDPDFSPDGSKIVFVGSDTQTYLYRAWTVNADGSGRALVTDDFEHAASPVWSPDGTHIAFTTFRNNGAPVVAIYTPGGTQAGTLPVEAYGLSWQPCTGDCTLSTQTDSSMTLFSYTGRKKTTAWATITPTHVFTDIKFVVAKRKDGAWRRVLSETKSTGGDGLATLRYPRIKRGKCKIVVSWLGDDDHFGSKRTKTFRCGRVTGGAG